MIYSILRGVRFALTDGDLPTFLFEHLARTSEEAQDLAFDVNADRRTARAMRGMRR